MNPEKIRKDFPILSGKLAYLDSAATTQKPVQVIDAMNTFYREGYATVHRGIYRLSEEATIAFETAHKKAGAFIRARPEDTIFTRNTTESLNLLAYTLTQSLQKGDEILLTQMEHHSNLVPWQQLAKQKSLSLKFTEIDEEGKLKPLPLTPKTKIVSVTQMSNVLGTINPVKEIAKQAHEAGALCVVDGAQSVPHFPVDVKKLGCDFLAFSGHKMLGPTGIGVLYGRKSLLEELPPFLFGGDMIKEVSFKDSTFNELPWKFEAGTPPIAEAIGLAAAADYLNKIGMDKVFEHEKTITKYAFEKLSEKVKIFGPQPQDRGGVISFSLEGVHPHDLATLLDQDNIAIRGGHHCAMPLMNLLKIDGTARASFYVYTLKEEIDRLAEGIEKARKIFG